MAPANRWDMLGSKSTVFYVLKKYIGKHKDLSIFDKGQTLVAKRLMFKTGGLMVC